MENKEEKFRHMMLEHDLYPSIKGPVFELMNKAYDLGQAEFIKLIDQQIMVNTELRAYTNKPHIIRQYNYAINLLTTIKNTIK